MTSGSLSVYETETETLSERRKCEKVIPRYWSSLKYYHSDSTYFSIVIILWFLQFLEQRDEHVKQEYYYRSSITTYILYYVKT